MSNKSNIHPRNIQMTEMEGFCKCLYALLSWKRDTNVLSLNSLVLRPKLPSYFAWCLFCNVVQLQPKYIMVSKQTSYSLVQQLLNSRKLVCLWTLWNFWSPDSHRQRRIKQWQMLLTPNFTRSYYLHTPGIAITCMKSDCWACPQSDKSQYAGHFAGQLAISKWELWCFSFLGMILRTLGPGG